MYTIISEKFVNQRTDSSENISGTVLAHIVCDTVDDLPEPLPNWLPGSQCDVLIDGGSTYILSHSGEWMEVINTSQGGGGSGEGDTVTKSLNNGNIRVNGKELVVYNDSVVQADVTANKADISALRTDVDTNNTDISGLRTDVDYNTDTVTTLQSAVARNTADISILQAGITKNAGDIADLQFDIDNIIVTTDYNDLNSKPQINSYELTGNKSAADLGLATAADMQTVQSKVIGIEGNVTTNTNSIANLQYEVSQIVVITNYNELDGKPRINGVELAGNKTAAELGLESSVVDSQMDENSDNAVSNKAIVEFVHNEISANAADFLGTFETDGELPESAQNNDYAFVSVTDEEGNTVYKRYKYNENQETWLFEYDLNNSSFTAVQWAAINSSLTSADKTKLDSIEEQATKNYENLDNKPKINDIELNGNMSLTALGLASAEDMQTVKSGLNAVENSVAVNAGDIAELKTEIEGITILTNYGSLENKPQINGVELTGNVSLSALGVAGAEDMLNVQKDVNTLKNNVEKNTSDIAKLKTVSSANASMPVGVIIAYGGVTAPDGWLMCHGQEVSRTEYNDLFAVIGTGYGSGDNFTTFNLPDLRETVPVGAGQNTTAKIAVHDVYTVGQFKDDQLQSHTHNYNTLTPTFVNPGWAGGNIGNQYGTLTTTANSGRTGTTTHGKQLGINYIIKAV